jgi:hypothetical protein
MVAFRPRLRRSDREMEQIFESNRWPVEFMFECRCQRRGSLPIPMLAIRMAQERRRFSPSRNGGQRFFIGRGVEPSDMNRLLRVLFPPTGLDEEAEPEWLAPAPRRDDPRFYPREFTRGTPPVCSIACGRANRLRCSLAPGRRAGRDAIRLSLRRWGTAAGDWAADGLKC